MTVLPGKHQFWYAATGLATLAAVCLLQTPVAVVQESDHAGNISFWLIL